MRYRFPLAGWLFVSFILTSCEFHCSVNGKPEEKTGANAPVHQDGATIYNNIQLKTNKLKINKAYLITKDGERIADDNFVDFTTPVKLILLIDSGWNVEDGKTLLGASEKIATESGRVLLDEKDLFGSTGEIDEDDAKVIALTATITIDKNAPPSTFVVSFRVWDKKGEGYAEGSYKLYSK